MIIEIEDIIKRRFKYKIMNTRINNKQNHSIITSNWFTPLEAFTPKPKYAKPLQYGKIKNKDVDEKYKLQVNNVNRSVNNQK